MKQVHAETLSKRVLFFHDLIIFSQIAITFQINRNLYAVVISIGKGYSLACLLYESPYVDTALARWSSVQYLQRTLRCIC